MTYKNYLQKLRNLISEKTVTLFKIQDELFDQEDGFFTGQIYDKYKNAHNEWQNAQNEITGFLRYITVNKINLNDEIPKSEGN